MTRWQDDPRFTQAVASQHEAGHTTPTVADDVTDLETRVAAMRRLGVTRWADIELGQDPTVPVDDDKVKERSQLLEKQEAERRERLRFAASGGPRFGGQQRTK